MCYEFGTIIVTILQLRKKWGHKEIKELSQGTKAKQWQS